MGNPKKQKAKEKKKRKQLAREKQHAKYQAAYPPVPRSFISQYANPDVLMNLGPLLRASWLVPKALEDALKQAGRPVPPPVHGYMLIDTGAVGTSMAQDVAEELQLRAIRIQETYGAGGLHRNPVFEAILGFSIKGKHGNLLSLSGEIQAMGIPRLQEYMRSLGLQTPDGFPSRMIGLLGRDLLRHATLTYEGSKGRFEFKLDLSTLQQTIVTS